MRCDKLIPAEMARVQAKGGRIVVEIPVSTGYTGRMHIEGSEHSPYVKDRYATLELY